MVQRKGSFVVEYVGEIISTKEAQERQKVYDERGMNYLLVLREWVQQRGAFLRTNIDGTYQGSIARFCNHSCEPNLKPFLVRVNSVVPRVGLFAVQDIPPEAELTFDYGVSSSENVGSDKYDCLCGTPSCRKKLPFNPNV